MSLSRTVNEILSLIFQGHVTHHTSLSGVI